RYTPDEQMRTVVAAVDRMCRGPGCTKPARSCDLDHVQEYPHGATRITNLAPVDRRHHGMKTNRWWSALMDADRTLTWTTLLGRVYMTGPHDYRQYVGTVRQALRRAEARGAGAGAGTGARAGAGAG